jgi:hypothetical protein
MGHTSLVSHECGKVRGLLGVILGEGLYFAAVAGGTFPRQETERAVAGCLVLTVAINASAMHSRTTSYTPHFEGRGGRERKKQKSGRDSEACAIQAVGVPIHSTGTSFHLCIICEKNRKSSP